MRFFSLPVLVFFALAFSSCAPEQTPVPPTTAEIPTDIQTMPTSTPELVIPSDTPSGPLGSISGNILPVAPDSGPTGAMRVGAREINTGQVTWIDIPDGQTTYTIPGLPVGKYIVLGWVYPDGVTGAYTTTGISTVKTSSEQLTCNNSVEEITLGPGQMDFTGADIGCWAGDYYFLLTPLP